jgi:RNA polymerase sigma-70 factor (ECF subfamily)
LEKQLDDERILEGLRAGDEDSFTALVTRYQDSMLRIALMYVGEYEVAQEVVQETWIAVLRGLDQFEGRSAFRTWLFSILMNRAKARAAHDNRHNTVALLDEDLQYDTPTVSPNRFYQEESAGATESWMLPPASWQDVPEEVFMSGEVRQVIDTVLKTLQPLQREVLQLRDLDGWTADEVCDVLNISAANQRVLLHRARAKVRQALEDYLKA